jgi:hypothetical protein
MNINRLPVGIENNAYLYTKNYAKILNSVANPFHNQRNNGFGAGSKNTTVY